ncbi:MAG: hypothetical protein DRP64_09795 [Verrucomicrobia bacterium]|nr:MAG: hypothetical protein DRP64_09795 [Verrucomicrobiota bacterium]
MPDINKVSVQRSIPFTGSYGNAATQVFDQAMPNGAIGDVIYLEKVAANSYLKGFKLQSVAAVGATGATLNFGYIMGGVTNATYFASAVAADAALNVSTASMPIACTDDLYIIATVAGAAIDVVGERVAMQTNLNYVGEVSA